MRRSSPAFVWLVVVSAWHRPSMTWRQQAVGIGIASLMLAGVAVWSAFAVQTSTAVMHSVQIELRRFDGVTARLFGATDWFSLNGKLPDGVIVVHLRLTSESFGPFVTFRSVRRGSIRVMQQWGPMGHRSSLTMEQREAMARLLRSKPALREYLPFCEHDTWQKQTIYWGRLGLRFGVGVASVGVLGWIVTFGLSLVVAFDRVWRKVNAGIRCVGCGYDLRGIDAARCPECGADSAPDK